MAYPSDLTRTKNWGTEMLTDSDLEGQLDLIINWAMAVVNASTGHTHDGTSNQGPKINITNLTVGSQAQGDIFYASSSTAWARLGAGTDGQCLTTQGTGANPTWSGMTTSGDIEYHSGSDRARLAKGTAYQILRMNSGATAPEWATNMEIVSGSYTGNGSDPQTITIGFSVTSKTPKFVLVAKGAASGSDSVSHYRMTGLSLGVALSDGTSQTNGIGTLAANAFDAGSTINTNAVTYYFIAIG